ncbi:MAG: anti-sigma factor domain-containing protein, partial [Caldanaerobacter sp.]
MKAIVIKKERNKAYLLTEEGQFITSKKFQKAEVGETVEIVSTSIVSPSMVKLLLAASIIIALIASLLTFKALEVYAYVYMKNPNIKAAIDKNGKIISITPMDEESKKILDKISYKGLDISTFIQKTIEESEKMGFLQENDKIVITTIPIKDTKNVNEVEKKVKEAVQNIQKSQKALKFEINEKETKEQSKENKDKKQIKNSDLPVKITNTAPEDKQKKNEEKQKIKIEKPAKVTIPDKELQEKNEKKTQEKIKDKQKNKS